MWPTQTNLQELENDFSDEEIKRAIWDLGQDKVSGPDDFPIFFPNFLVVDQTRSHKSVQRIEQWRCPFG